MKRLSFAFILVCIFVLPQAALAGDAFLTPGQVDLTKLLAPPPAPDSQTQKDEIAELLAMQKSRTPEQEAAAKADTEQSVFRFAQVMGPGCTPENLPRTSGLFKKAEREAASLIPAAQDHWKRSRPFAVSQEIAPCVQKPGSPSYPSGAATFGTLAAILLANMVPEKAVEIFGRGQDLGKSRLIGGVHYPSDVAAGRIAGTVIAAFLLQNPAFMAEFKEAKAELRNALGVN